MKKMMGLLLSAALLSGCGSGYASDNEPPLPTDPNERYLAIVSEIIATIEDSAEEVESNPADAISDLEEALSRLYAIDPPTPFKESHGLLMRATRYYGQGIELYREGQFEEAIASFSAGSEAHDSYYLRVSMDYSKSN